MIRFVHTKVDYGTMQDLFNRLNVTFASKRLKILSNKQDDFLRIFQVQATEEQFTLIGLSAPCTIKEDYEASL